MKEIMVDLDNTLVDFTRMLFNHIKQNFNYSFNADNLEKYDFCTLFYKEGCNKEEVINFFNTAYKDETLYTEQLIKSEYFDKIMNMIKQWKNKGYKIICHTKVSSDEMYNSKDKMFKNIFNNIFDDIILEHIDSKEAITSTKDYHYDIIVDDSPYIVEDYLNKNDTGIVYLPETNYNRYILENNKFSNRVISLKEI